jgi:hypothetical protein
MRRPTYPPECGELRPIGQIAAELTPADLDPATHPILSRHWFGVESSRLVCPLAAEVVADLRRRRHVQQVHRLGDRVFGELLAELGAERDIGTIIDRKLDTYAELEPEVLEAAGGDRFWPVPLREVRRAP